MAKANVNGKTWRAIQDRDLPSLLDYFQIRMPEAGIHAHHDEISARFTREAGEIVRLCARIPEREKHLLFREALRLSCESVVTRSDR